MEGKIDYRNGIMSVLTIVYQVMLLNILWLVFSIPIITIGASTKALVGSIRDMIKGDFNHEIKTYFFYFKSNFWKTTLVFLLQLVAYAIVLVNLIMMPEVSWLLTWIQLPVLVQLLITTTIINYILLDFDLSVFKTIKVAWIIGNRNIIKSIGVVVIIYLFLKLSLGVPFIILFFFVPVAAILHYYFCSTSVESIKGEA